MSGPLEDVVREVELHAARAGWEQPAQLFALVDTADLLAASPTWPPCWAWRARRGTPHPGA